jgi:hypothetical protein
MKRVDLRGSKATRIHFIGQRGVLVLYVPILSTIGGMHNALYSPNKSEFLAVIDFIRM